MKRKTFTKQLMAKGIQRNEAAYLSREICKTHFSRDTSYAIGHLHPGACHGPDASENGNMRGVLYQCVQ